MSSEVSDVSKDDVLELVTRARGVFEHQLTAKSIDDYTKALIALRKGLPMFVESEAVREFLDDVLFAEIQTAQHIEVAE